MICERLFSGNSFDHTIVVQGLAGIGKSQLVATYARNSLLTSTYSAVFWLDASSPLHLASSFSKVRERIDNNDYNAGPVKQIEEGLLSVRQLYERFKNKGQSTEAWRACANSGDVQAVKRWLAKKRNNKWLIVFDNYQPSTSSNDDGEVTLIERFFPKEKQGHVIITSRFSPPVGHTIILGKIKCPHEALDIFCRASVREEIRKGTIS